jgi:predicted nucleic acid-binding protein
VLSGLPRVYLETTVISYLTARPSRNLRVVAHREITADWWARRRMRFELYVSRLVIDEASAGDVEAAAQRLVTLSGIPRLELTEAASLLAESLVTGAAIPREAIEDALHVAVAAAHGMDYLLTWNCRHIANAAMRNRIADVCASSGFEAPVICTPEELLED